MIELIIPARSKDLGGFSVRRILPFSQKHMVGPFIFLDHFGPMTFSPGQGIDVRPHPHIGLATMSYLFEGQILHRDSLGSEQIIQAGEVNWMVAGRGIVHSERTVAEDQVRDHALHGLQSWVALPVEHETCDPQFFHYAYSDLPELSLRGARIRIIAGEAYGKQSPVKTFSPMFYVEVYLPAGASLKVPDNYSERAVYPITGELSLSGQHLVSSNLVTSNLAVLGPGQHVLQAVQDTHLMLLGGEPLKEVRFIDWNFVSSSQERIEQAKLNWQKGLFPKVPGDEQEFIPLPINP